MPNYGLVVDSEYTPMTYEDYAAPFKDYAKVYNTMVDAYDALEMEANKWEKLANSAKDAQQYAQYKNYADSLREASNDLQTNGLSTKTRGTVSNLRKRYSSEIQPIEDAYTLREEEEKLQRQEMLHNPDIMYNRYANETGLGDYMSGLPELSAYSGDKIYNYAAKAAGNIARIAREEAMSNDPQKQAKWKSILGDEYYEKMIRTGLTPADVLGAMYNSKTGEINPQANEYLQSIMDNAVGMSGMKQWGNWDKMKDRAYGYAWQGMWDALGQTTYDRLSNKMWDLNHSGGSDKEDLFAINPVPIYSPSMAQADAEDQKILFEYITPGTLTFTDMSFKKLKGALNKVKYSKKIASLNAATTAYGGIYVPGYSKLMYGDEFRILYDLAKKDNPGMTHDLFYKALNSEEGKEYIEALVQGAFVDGTMYRTNAELRNEYSFGLEANASKDVQGIIEEASGGTLYEADFDPKRGGWYNTGKQVTTSNVFKTDNPHKISNIYMGEYGTTFSINGKRYLLPKNINPTAENNMNIAIQKASIFAQALEKNKKIIRGKNGDLTLSDIDLSEQEQALYYMAQVQAQQDIYKYMSTILNLNKTHKQSVPIEYN